MATGALTPERDFLDVRDVCVAYLAALTAMLPAGTVLNIASGRAVRISAVLDQLLALAHCKVTAREDPARLRPVEIPRAVGDAGLAAKLLNWTPRIPLATTLGDVLNATRQGI